MHYGEDSKLTIALMRAVTGYNDCQLVNTDALSDTNPCSHL